jgi:hypothetical protein
VQKEPVAGRYYDFAWVPAQLDQHGVILVLDTKMYDVVFLHALDASAGLKQISDVAEISQIYNNAVVYAVRGHDEAMLKALEYRGTWVQKVTFTNDKWEATYENLHLLLFNGKVSYPAYSQLMAELDAVRSSSTISGKPDYPRYPTIQALCLLTHELPPYPDFLDDIYYSYDPDLI